MKLSPENQKHLCRNVGSQGYGNSIPSCVCQWDFGLLWTKSCDLLPSKDPSLILSGVLPVGPTMRCWWQPQTWHSADVCLLICRQPHHNMVLIQHEGKAESANLCYWISLICLFSKRWNSFSDTTPQTDPYFFFLDEDTDNHDYKIKVVNV